jgi:hypothetical protein
LCDSCQFYSNNPNLVCAVHPGGVSGDKCLDYRPDVDYIFEEQWHPPGYCYYNGELIKLPEKKLTQTQQLWLLENHPCFTGVCRECGYVFPKNPQNWCKKRIKFYNF